MQYAANNSNVQLLLAYKFSYLGFVFLVWVSKKYDVPENVNTFVAAKPQQCDIDRCLF